MSSAQKNTLNCALNFYTLSVCFFLFIKAGEIDVSVVSQLILPSNSDLNFPWFYRIIVLGTNKKKTIWCFTFSRFWSKAMT